MGPHFFKCGKVYTSQPANLCRKSLQWGRTFSSAERMENPKKTAGGNGFNGAALFQVRKVRRKMENHREVDELQWGRTFSSAERQTLLAGKIQDNNTLQWGRTFSSAERLAKVHREVFVPIASMGPHFFKCGKA